MKRLSLVLVLFFWFTTFVYAWHRHQCPFCTYTWGHNENSSGNLSAHTCPKCGKVLPGHWYHYNGPTPAGQYARPPICITPQHRPVPLPKLPGAPLKWVM